MNIAHPREIVTLHVGQAGVQLGNAAWETMIAEHAVNVDGSRKAESSPSEISAASTFFHEAPLGRLVPRALIVDTEPTVVDEIRTGFYRKLFQPDFLISGIEDAANNFARGYYTIGRKMLHQILERIRYIIESCDNFKGFMSYSGSGGGTGSGLYSLLLERIMLEYSGRTLFGTLILAGQTLNDSIVDPYNSILRINQSISSDLNLLIDNESMYKLCFNKLNILQPTYINLNRLVAPILSSITAPFRFQGPLISDISEISTNLIPFPRINFPTVCYSPFVSKKNSDYSFLNSTQLLYDVFKPDHNLLGINLQKGKLMSSVLTFRGLHHMNTIIEQLHSMKKNHLYEWVDWCPTGFKITQCEYPTINNFQVQPQNSILMMCNHSEITVTIDKLYKKYSILFSKRSFVHWFIGEGMESDEMIEAKENVRFLKNDYEEVCKGANIDNESNKTIIPITLQDSRTSKKSSVEIEKKQSTLFLKNNSEEKLSTKPVSLIKKQKSSITNSSRSIEQTKVLTAQSSQPNSEEYQINPKAKEILFKNVTTLSPEVKQRMFGYVE